MISFSSCSLTSSLSLSLPLSLSVPLSLSLSPSPSLPPLCLSLSLSPWPLSVALSQSVFHELSEEIRKLPLAEQEYPNNPHNTTNHLLESNISFDYDPNNSSFRGAGDGGGGGGGGMGGTGSSTGSQGLNHPFQSVPESPIHRSSSPTRFRDTTASASSPTHGNGNGNVPFIPRSSTHRYLPNSPFRKSNPSGTMNNTSMNTDQLGEIIREAIGSAVEAAQTQWIKELKNGTFTHPDFAGSESFYHRFTQLSSKVDILQDQVRDLPLLPSLLPLFPLLPSFPSFLPLLPSFLSS
jgi:hypothetical protein